MQPWRGWTATAQTAVTTAPTWEVWCTWQRRLLLSEQHRQEPPQEDSLFSERELAHLSFVRWLYHGGHFDSLDPARSDHV
jgi:hypothetical protein